MENYSRSLDRVRGIVRNIPRRTETPHERYMLNWVEPQGMLVVGWYQDETDDDRALVHLQVTAGSAAIAHQSVKSLDSHPLGVVERSRTALRQVLLAL